ncbi:D-2-hydroxyacid dehydrogenase family protein [Bosea psychrotolerans]|uniref:Lactate dehydrogenase-like 2-hydroxyacid dehydrogenase n=1 Tax=Bosea psychrotolerans TaxID=1871628 RepID=A0A2S4M2T1_9HYPH|nr:D-2-hydroxyacid dehydrogenase family protein [Bosea psychrotolerans]POR48947.1 lactate dehydrogenase-like 2-hydroxyacid dehydrogenase [Bosea psychrotolerans]
MNRPLVIVLDDSQHVARQSADWSGLEARADVRFLSQAFASEEAVAAALADAEIIIPTRERTAFGASLIGRLPKLRLLALTGGRAQTLDLAACTAAGVIVSNTGGKHVGAATAELAFALILANARSLPQADALMRAGGWHEGLPLGDVVAGKRLGIVGLGKLGQRVARYAKAFDMEVVAWSQNLTAEAAAAAGVAYVGKDELFATSDVVSLHLVLSERTRGIVGAAELAAMKRGACLVNTARGPLIDEGALLEHLRKGAIRAALDVYDQEPLPRDHPLRSLPNVVLTPHQGYSAAPVLAEYYGESIENALAFLDGKPTRVMNPEVLGRS